ncbi:MAG: DNA polymerase Y family protein [Actinomycetia bacterium]|nr:DNA polymerase Y family protein [Actinomycetes bacterium]
MTPPRTLVVWCPDWPVVATGTPLHEPVVVVYANRVVAASPAARAEGVRRGLRRREAQGRSPGAIVVERDEVREARRFEPVVAALETLTPRIEITRPGSCRFLTRGPSRYFGGDQALVDLVLDTVTRADPDVPCRVGVADGPFAANLAARQRTPAGRPFVVDSGATPAFLAPLPLSALEDLELVDVLVRLGLRTLGDLAALDVSDVLGRFGPPGALAHRRASGLDDTPPAARQPPPDWSVTTQLDPPAERVDVAAFAAKRLADELHDRLEREGAACVRLLVEAETEHGEVLQRLWRDEGALTAAATADRVRWQLDGWLSGSAVTRPSGGLIRLTLAPDEIAVAAGRQLGFWGGTPGADESIVRALARAEALLGAGSVTVPERRGGRGPHEQLTLIPVSSVDLTGQRIIDGLDTDAPWPGQLPAPSPALVHRDPIPATVVDPHGESVRVTGRGLVSGEPALVAIDDGPPVPVAGWAGPWPADEWWWDPDRHRRRARIQVTLTSGPARLLVLESGRWWLEATYD